MEVTKVAMCLNRLGLRREQVRAKGGEKTLLVQRSEAHSKSVEEGVGKAVGLDGY